MMSEHHRGRRTDDDISQMLRGALGDTDFDYESLVSGVHQRAGRIRRRRAIATGAAVAVLGPALVGGAALVLPDVLGDQATVVGPAATTDVALSTTAEPSEEATQTAEPTVEDPPWQDGQPPMPEGPEETEGSIPNDWEIPDPRPTDVTVLDRLGAPQYFSNYPRTPAVSGMMTCDPANPGGIEPLSGQSSMFFTEDGSGPTIDITVTGWEDGEVALDALLTDGAMLCSWDANVSEAQPWPGHEGDEDYLTFSAGEDTHAAVVQQGDYLIAVTVRDEADPDSGADVAAEIASKSADNLEALDPVHGRD